MTTTARDWTPVLAARAEEFGVPGAALAVLAGGEVVEAAAGVTNRRTGCPATPDTLFQIGSLTKVWTTTLLLGLADEGRVDLGAPVRRYLPDLVLQDSGAAEQITVRHLLNHTSGLPGDYFPDTGRGDDCLEKYLPLLAEIELTHPVGALFSYSNAAFVLAGLLVERLTGGTWDTALRDRVIEPLGLPRTVTLPEDALLHRTAVGHVGQGAAQAVAPRWMLPRNCGPAGLITAQARDVAEFARLHLDGGVGATGKRILSEAAVASMQEVTVPMPGAAEGRLGFGLGWGLSEWSGSPVLQHDGGTIGQAAALRVLPRERVALVLLTNGGNWTGFRDAVLAEVAAEVAGVEPPAAPQPADPPAAVEGAALSGLAGRYTNMGADLTVSERDGRLLLQHRALDELEALATSEATEMELLPQGGDRFLGRMPESPAWMPVLFLRDQAGAVEYVHLGGRAARRRG